MRRRRTARAIVATAACASAAGFAAGCEDATRGATWALTADAPVDLRHARWEPPDAVAVARRAGSGRLELELRAGFRGRVRVEAPGACAADATFDGPRSPPRTTELALKVRIPEHLADQGFDSAVEIAVARGCDGGGAPKIAWRALGDAPLEVLDDGLRVRTRTPPLSRALAAIGSPAASVSWGLVPISPRTQGAVELEARWDDGPTTFTHAVRITAAPRATGIPTIAAGGHAYLFGEGWTAHPDPRGRAPALAVVDGFTRVDTSLTGRFVLSDASGRRLGLRVGRYDEMPLDCARADCHDDAGHSIAASPMTHVFERGLTGALGPRYDPRCALACHTLGEPGANDGGFAHLARLLGTRVPAAPDAAWFADMPRPLRRASGVGCIACHGPAAIPEPDARWSALRADVCAICHDAPPKYGHVAAWRTSRMASSDRAPETREGECATCHTTAGFLGAIGARKELRVPSDAGPLGIACAACHSPHARDAGAALVRRAPASAAGTKWDQRFGTRKSPGGDFGVWGEAPGESSSSARALSSAHAPRKLGAPFMAGGTSASLGAPDVGPSGVCLACHGGRDDEPAESTGSAALPRASAARLVFSPGPHATPRGCLACHGVAHDPSAAVHGEGHAFKPNAASCRASACHGEPPVERRDARGRTIAQRADALWQSLVRRGAVVASSGPAAHADPRFAVAPGAPSSLADAARRVALVHEDRAAFAHNAARARALLDEADALMR